MTKQITTQEVKTKVDSGKKDYYLIDVLMQNSFEGKHIPTAINIPYETRFLKEFEAKVGAPKDAQIIVYCASSGCQLSHMAATDLEEAGYMNVYHYADGIAGWQNAGYEFEGQNK